MNIKLEFPKRFYWGAATASYQIEGGIYNNDWAQAAEQGKLPSAGESTDHYNRYKEDFDLAKELGHNSSRISIEWSRIEPKEGEFDQKEIEHYREVLKYMKSVGLEPFVTLWHFTIPTWLSDRGGMAASDFPKIFSRYCKFVVDNLHNECKFWATINEPNVVCSNGYTRGNWPPFQKNVFNLLKALKNLSKGHNLSYQEIKKDFPNLEVGIVKNNIHFTSDWKPWNKISAGFVNWFWDHRFLRSVKDNVDSIGLNYYFHFKFGKGENLERNDMGWNLYPKGIYYMLIGLKRYNKPVYVTEAGIPDREDKKRPKYIKDLVRWTHQAIVEGVNVRGFMYWSLIDNFEWAKGYEEEFGIIHIDKKTKERIIRDSAYVYKKICEENILILE